MSEKEEDPPVSDSEDKSEQTVNEEAAQNLDNVQDQNSENNAAGASEDNQTDNQVDNQAVVKDKKDKIDILLRATANAPILKQKKWAVPHDHTIGRISDFVRKYLKMAGNERLFLYINQTFAPAPDQTVKNLYDCYGTDGKLIIHYSISQAWG